MYVSTTQEQGMIINQPLPHGAGVLILTEQRHARQGVHWRSPPRLSLLLSPQLNSLMLPKSFFLIDKELIYNVVLVLPKSFKKYWRRGS